MKRKLTLNTKVSIMIISFIAAVIIFIGIISIQRKIINPNGRENVYFAKKSIDENTVITMNNVNNYFIKKEVDKDTLIDDPISNQSDLIKKYVDSKVLKGEQISSKKLQSVAKQEKQIKNLREYSIKFDDISETVGGTLREGDYVDFIITEKREQEDKTVTQTVLKNVLVDKAISQDGTEIKRGSADNRTATVLNLYLSAEDAHKLDNAVSIGKVKALKVLDKTQYNDITIQTNN
ncbi:hypothetical protein KYB31_07820 [Clostridium felsineum]|uniref:Flp pilus assembly protein CpaB n=1 Tax=Clostridium felsineum TaxID=36839 RepID=UPI00214D80F5|nr:RcpC/CpaB family pilus assembly protein [Clostridium felsineum]MCR3758896.1 hypothetical protein [Clostridium felsineum]